MSRKHPSLKLVRLGIDTYTESVIYMRADSHICRAEGFEAPARIHVELGDRSVIATLNTVESDLLKHNEAGLSQFAWDFLQASEGDEIYVSHPKTLDSLSYIRSKLYGNALSALEIDHIISDIVTGQLSDIHLTMFLSALTGNKMNSTEIVDLTKSMINVGETLKWPYDMVVDKHCIGGLPGNRTTPIVVAIVAAFGLIIPKTSSRAITSPAGTADTMEVFAPVGLSIHELRKVVEKENGCITWGGSVGLSPADDLLIRIERVMDIDSIGQMVASIVSKKIAAGSTNILIDVPMGPTTKIRSKKQADALKNTLHIAAKAFGIDIQVILTDGSQPIGRGIGPALEARDILDVLSCKADAPEDLRNRSLMLAGHILEFSPKVEKDTGIEIAKTILDSGKALNKFLAICEAQGGIFEIPYSKHTHTVTSKKSGTILTIDNRIISKIAKLAGAPNAKAAGVELFVKNDSVIQRNQPLFNIHAETRSELNYALNFFEDGHDVFSMAETS